MDIDKIQSFVTVCSTKNFTDAAEQLYTSQANISKHLKSIETELQCQLILRKGRQFDLTEAGEVFLVYAENIIRTYQQAINELNMVKTNEKVRLSFGTTASIGANILPKYLSNFKYTEPTTKLSMKIDQSQEILNLLNKGQIDFAILSHYITQGLNSYKYIPLIEDKLIVIVPPNHPLAKKESCKLSELNKETFLIKHSQASLNKYLAQELNHPPFLTENRLEVGSQNNIKHFVQNGLGISIVSTSLIREELKEGKIGIIEIEGLQLTRTINIVIPKNKKLFPTSINFVKYLTKNVRNL
ncbi:LysR family transcriptional regulator [Ignavigranum ruoffiae]|uniref:LysR family transcriptional regulator n=1 Tax=Ignavigranum ruoffiae TaxID=89093 RepID=UPI0024AE74DC|nr:LysR family transcriptional regulator [Ignavigranum ruoffiae]